MPSKPRSRPPLHRGQQKTAAVSLLLEYWKDDGWYMGRLKGIPGVFSQGQTLTELEENIRDAYRLILGTVEKAPAGAKTKQFAIKA